MANIEEYYKRLSLPPVPPLTSQRKKSISPAALNQKYQETQDERHLREMIQQVDCPDLGNKLTVALDNMVASWRDKHDSLVDAFDQLEKLKKKQDQRVSVQSQNHERSIKEAQLYKARLEQSQQQQKMISNTRRGSMLSSNASCISSKSFLSSSSSRRSSSSCASSVRQSFFMVDELIDPVLFDSQLLLEDSDNDEDGHCGFQLHPGLTDPDSPYPTMTRVPSPQTFLKAPYNNDSKAIVAAPPPTESPYCEGLLTFACGDGFWNTIATGRREKAVVDSLIENYIRRGGKPNIAKSSDSVKSVKEGYGLIHALIAIRNTAALQRLIGAGANANVCTLSAEKEHQTTPLILAAKLGYLNGVRLLLEKGNAKILENRGPYGENALHAAVQSRSNDLVSYLLIASKNALLEMEDDNGATPLHYACTVGKTHMVTLFVRDCQAKPDPKDRKGETPLHYAVRNRKINVIAKLVGEFGVYPNPYIVKQVPTPLDLAKQGGLKTITEYLKGEGAKTTKEMEKTSRNNSTAGTVYSSNSSTFSGESSGSGGSIGPASAAGVRQFLHTKTSQILRGTFDL